MENSKINDIKLGKSKKYIFRRGFKTRADRLAVFYRNQLNLKPHDPLPARKLAEFLNIAVKFPIEIKGISPEIISDLFDDIGSSSFSAVTIGKERPSLIIHNPNHSLARQESNIMHECAHIILEHKMEVFDSSYGFLLRQYNEDQEHEAEWLGGCLQLSKECLIRHYIYNQKTKVELENYFLASKQMITYRIGVCGIEVMKKRIEAKHI